MFLDTAAQLRRERQKNEKLTSDLARARADLDYVTMMTGVEVPMPEDCEEGNRDGNKPEI